MSAIRRILPAAVAGIFLASCAEAPLTPAIPQGPVTLDVVSGDGQVALAGTELPTPLKVRATANGRKLSGVLVNFRVVAGSGRMYAGAAITDRDGIAQDWWTLGTEVLTTQQVEVVAVDPSTGQKQNYGSFTARGATGAAATLAVAPATRDFGGTTVGTPTASTTFTVMNTGVASANGISVTLGGADATSFALTGDSCSTSSLAFGQTCTVDVRFSPQGLGLHTGSLSVTPSSGAGASASLVGTGLGTPVLAINPTSFDFGSAIVGSTGVLKTFTVTNSGNGATGSLSTQVSGSGAAHFQLVSNSCAQVTLSPSGTCSVTVYFHPSAAGSHTASLDVSGSPGGIVSAALTGVGVAPAQLSISPTSAVFPTTFTGSTSSPISFTVTNTGGSATGNVNLNKVGTHPFDFVVTANGCGAPLNPGQSCIISVVFQPTGSGTRTAQLVVLTINVPSVSASLSGNGL